ncbi:MAG: OmpA family protein [Xanthomonadales bacterium]|nr:OmpA family protein [Xanthomonadales bacterium]
MSIRFRVLLVAALAFLLSACASTGSQRLSSDWKNCMAAGLVVGAAAGATDDAEAVRETAAAGAIIGSLVCAFMRKDADGDGVHDDDDRCPGTPKGAEVDQNGCQPDLDGDGVPDSDDQCPDTASGARVDARGCEVDSDGDGVKDSADRCPGTVAGAAVDSDGCELDSDGDGVKDSADECPETEAGVAVDNRGCDLPQEYRLKGIYFEYDSARLTSASVAAIKDALTILNRHEDLQVEIAGHTDSRGTVEYNQGLSQRRADAVLRELVAKGIDPARLTARGYGESQPVAGNDTDEGRAKNRRVELRHD